MGHNISEESTPKNKRFYGFLAAKLGDTDRTRSLFYSVLSIKALRKVRADRMEEFANKLAAEVLATEERRRLRKLSNSSADGTAGVPKQ